MKKIMLLILAVSLATCGKLEQARVSNYADAACQKDISTSITKSIKDQYQIDYQVSTAGLTGVLKNIYNGKYSSLTYDLKKDGAKYHFDFVFSKTDSGCQMVLIEKTKTKGSANTSSKNNMSGIATFDVACECEKVVKK